MRRAPAPSSCPQPNARRLHRPPLLRGAGPLALVLIGACLAAGCAPADTEAPPAGGSESAAPAGSVGSSPSREPDPRALEIADQVVEAMGGHEAWEATRYVTWVNFGKRLEVWDKQTDDIRVENDATVVLMNARTREGRAFKFGREITDPEELARALEFGWEAFQLDRHEMLLPFLLRDEGIHLEYLGDGEAEGRPTDVLRVTFDEGAPYSRAEYRLHIDRESRLLVQWDYYVDRGDERPRFYLPWSNYEKYGRLLLSDVRGPERHLEVHVFDELPASVFESPEPVPWLQPDA
jgi:hypothetical protein